MRSVLGDYSYSYRKDIFNRLLSKGSKLIDPSADFFDRRGVSNLISMPHSLASEIEHEIGKIYQNFFKFAFVRNPWDWQVSLYKFMLKDKAHRQHHIIKKFKEFDEYINWRVSEDMHFQSDYLLGSDGEPIDFIGRFENLQEDFHVISQKLGLKNAKLPILNISNSGGYQKYYSRESKKIIENAYQKDIQGLGYTFDSYSSIPVREILIQFRSRYL